MHDPLLEEIEKVLGRVNAGLREILPKVKDPEILKALTDLERDSRWKRQGIDDGQFPMDFAIARARTKAAEYGEPVVVFEALEGSKLVIMTRQRFQQEKPFGARDKDVVFATDLQGAK